APAASSSPEPASQRQQQPYQQQSAPTPPGDTRTTKELMEECQRRALDTSGCSVRDDLIDLLRQNPVGASAATGGSNKAPPSVPAPPARSGTAPRLSAAQPAPPPARPAPKAQATFTVWDRRTVPASCTTRKQQALFLLGFDPLRAVPSPSDLRSAYKRAAMESHPDRQQNHGRQAEAKEVFQKVKDGFDYLSPIAQ
ncbi:unnamed protein product, partial [Polarella glacialis]